MTSRLILALCFAFITLSPSVYAEEDLVAAQKFFESYIEAGSKYDKALLDMFTPDAVEHITVLGDDGAPVNADYNAERIQQSLTSYIEDGAKQGIKIRFDKVAYAATPTGVRVTATTEYQHLCYSDELYTALLVRNDKGEYKIKEEFSRLPAKSQCQKP